MLYQPRTSSFIPRTRWVSRMGTINMSDSSIDNPMFMPGICQHTTRRPSIKQRISWKSVYARIESFHFW